MFVKRRGIRIRLGEKLEEHDITVVRPPYGLPWDADVMADDAESKLSEDMLDLIEGMRPGTVFYLEENPNETP